MLCQNCEIREATAHFKVVYNGERSELHLCPECVRLLGYDGFSPSAGAAAGGSFRQGASSGDPLRCELCGSSFEQIERTCRAGCPKCFEYFGQKLGQLMTGIHGSAVYSGGGIGEAASETQKNEESEAVRQLRKRLADAVAAEDFETAAKIRDEIRRAEV